MPLLTSSSRYRKLNHLYCEMGIVKTKQTLRHVRKQSATGDLLIICLKWTHLLLGTKRDILVQTDHDIDYIDTTWWHGIRSFLRSINGSLVFEHSTLTLENVVNDISLMDAMNNDLFTLKEKRRINTVRLYLQVTFLSDIVHPHLPSLLSCYLEGNRDVHSKSKLTWPPIDTPPQEDIKLWKRALLMTFAVPGSIHLKHHPSRVWYPPHKRSRDWLCNIIIQNEAPVSVTYNGKHTKIDEITRRHLQLGRIS